MLIITVVNLGSTAVLGAVLYLLPHALLNAATVPFGVRVPPDHTNAPEIVTQRRRYAHRLITAAAVITPLAVISGAILRTAVSGAVGAILLTATAAVLWARANRTINHTKQHHGWYEHSRQGIAADTSLRTDPVRFPWPWAIPSLVIIAGTTGAGIIGYPHLPPALTWPVALGPVVAQVLATTLAAATTALVLRARADIDVTRPRDGAARYRRYLTAIARAVMVSTALIDLMLLGLAAVLWTGNRSPWLFALATVPPVLGSLAVWAHLLVRVGPAGTRLPTTVTDEPPTGLLRRDDDRFWRAAGTIYLNPDDPAAVVPSRTGTGWTLNAGNPRVFLAAAVVLALAAAITTVITAS
ncbi:membrane protein [Actinoplanes sp. NBRC 14428]|nr:membrane protein [Actinoplanes sp. NBRC 14428]